MQIVKPLQSLQARPTWLSWSSLMNIPSPFSPEMMMIVIDHDTNIYIEWHNIINGNGKKHQSLWRGICPGPRPSSPPSCFLSWHGDYKTQYPYHGSSWPTITRKIQDRIQTTTSKLRNKSTFFNGMGPRLGNGISPCSFAFLRSGIWQAIPKSFCFSEKIFCFLFVSFLERMKCKANLG